MPKPKRPVLSPLDRRLRDWLDEGGLTRRVFIQFDGEDFFVETSEGGSSVAVGFYGHTPAAAIRAMLDGQEKRK